MHHDSAKVSVGRVGVVLLVGARMRAGELLAAAAAAMGAGSEAVSSVRAYVGSGVG